MANYLQTDWDYNSERLVELFDELPLWAAPFGIKLLDAIEYKKGIQALDIGFGAGFPLTELAMRLGSHSKVFGIDPWNSAVDRAKKKIDFYGIKNIEIIRGVAENIPLNDRSIDLIVSNNGLNNVSDPEKALSECSRVIKAGGQFIQSMNLNSTMIEFYTVMEKVLTDLKLDTCITAMNEQIYKKRKPLDQYLQQIKLHGFFTESVKHDAFSYKFVDGTTLLNHHFIRLSFLDGWKEIVPIQSQKVVFKQIEQELNKKSQADGLIQLSVPFVIIDCKKHEKQ